MIAPVIVTTSTMPRTDRHPAGAHPPNLVEASLATQHTYLNRDR